MEDRRITKKDVIKALMVGVYEVPVVGTPISALSTEQLKRLQEKGFPSPHPYFPLWVLSAGEGHAYWYGDGSGNYHPYTYEPNGCGYGYGIEWGLGCGSGEAYGFGEADGSGQAYGPIPMDKTDIGAEVLRIYKENE